jgi:hypothetical protein
MYGILFTVGRIPFLRFRKNECHGSKVALKLMDLLVNKKYHVITDNWFSSSEMCYKLRSKQAAAMGTLHQNRKDVPAEIKKEELIKGKYVSVYTQTSDNEVERQKRCLSYKYHT